MRTTFPTWVFLVFLVATANYCHRDDEVAQPGRCKTALRREHQGPEVVKGVDKESAHSDTVSGPSNTTSGHLN